jgi:acetyltransferase-like isoleucine patch superfamily enzyme
MPGLVGIGLRYVLIRRLANACGSVVAIHSGCYIYYPERLSIGEHVSFHPMCYVDACGTIELGSGVSLAHGVTIMSTEHQFDDDSILIRDAPVRHEAVRIGNDVWIGAGARILAGTTIGERSIVAAGAVVTRDVPERTIVAGVPARVIRTLDQRPATGPATNSKPDEPVP